MRRALVAIPVLLAAACGVLTAPGPDVRGAYALQTVDGKTLPLKGAYNDAGDVSTLESGSLELRDDGVWTFETRGTLNRAGEITRTDGSLMFGRWQLTGETLHFCLGKSDDFRICDPSRVAVALSGDAITLTDEGAHTYLFRR